MQRNTEVGLFAKPSLLAWQDMNKYEFPYFAGLFDGQKQTASCNHATSSYTRQSSVDRLVRKSLNGLFPVCSFLQFTRLILWSRDHNGFIDYGTSQIHYVVGAGL